MNCQVQCFRQISEYKEAALPFLHKQPSHLNQLLAASERLTQERAEKNQAWLGCLREDGNVSAVAICTSVLPIRQLSISDWPAVAMPLLIEALGDFPVDSVVGPFASAKACAHTLGFRHLKVRLQNYALLEPPATQTAPGHARLMERKDIPWLTDWFSAFEIECNLPCSPRPELMQQFEEDLVRGSPRRCRIWEAGGESVAMANMVCIGAVARIGPVYTAPGQRARGYAGALVAHLGTEAFAQGALAVCLYADAENPVSNALYQRIGFRHIGDFGQFERDGSP